MSHIPFTLIAYFFNALAVLSNKFLLNKTIPDPLIYVFYVSLLSLLVLPAIPFTRIPEADVFMLASLSTILWTLGAYFMFKALKLGQVSRVIPVIGTAVPLILLIFASGTNTISMTQERAVLILIAGMVFLTLTDWQGRLEKKEIIFEILSAAGFALSYIVLRQAYLNLNFFSVLVWSRLILLPFCLAFLLFRHKLKINLLSGGGILFLGGQASGMISELLILFSISLANPALVNSLQGAQYVFLLIFALVLSKKYPAIFEEKYTFLTIISKLAGISLIGIGLFLLTN